MKDTYRAIRAYNTGWLLQLADWLLVVPGLKFLVRKTAQSLTMDIANKDDLKGGAMLLSNHRDIIMDAAWLSLLLRMKRNIRPYMGIGNNLYGRWWIEPFFRMNRGFTVMRGGTARDILRNSQLLSGYIHLLRRRKRCVWLAQREGRAKDGNDLTQHAVIKMLVMSYEKKGNATGNQGMIDALRQLNICPVCINYQYDPCDYLKAQEMQLKRDNQDWKKSKEDDILSMKTGVVGQKGQVVYRITESLNHWIDQNESALLSMNRNQLVEAVANQIDLQIHRSYEIYPHDAAFEAYLESRLKLIDIPNKDESFLREKLHEMYNNPILNYEKSHLSR